MGKVRKETGRRKNIPATSGTRLETVWWCGRIMYDHVDDDDHDDDDDDDDGDDDDDCVRMKILQTMMLWKLMWRRRADPTTGTHTSCEPAQSKCISKLHQSHVMPTKPGNMPRAKAGGPHFVRACAAEMRLDIAQRPCRNLEQNCPSPGRPDQAPAFPFAVRAPQCGQTVWRKKCRKKKSHKPQCFAMFCQCLTAPEARKVEHALQRTRLQPPVDPSVACPAAQSFRHRLARYYWYFPTAHPSICQIISHRRCQGAPCQPTCQRISVACHETYRKQMSYYMSKCMLENHRDYMLDCFQRKESF